MPQALKYMSYNEMTGTFGRRPAPSAPQAVHKHGYVPDTHGDVRAITRKPGRSLYYCPCFSIARTGWNGTTPSTMQELAHATWGIFEQMAQGQADTPAAPADGG